MRNPSGQTEYGGMGICILTQSILVWDYTVFAGGLGVYIKLFGLKARMVS